MRAKNYCVPREVARQKKAKKMLEIMQKAGAEIKEKEDNLNIYFAGELDMGKVIENYPEMKELNIKAL